MKKEDIQVIFQEFQEKINQISDLKLLEELKTFYLGRKGKIAELIKQIPLLSPEERPVFGKEINVLKQKLQDLFTRKKEELEEKVSEGVKMDPTLPGIRFNLGSIHPITTVIEEICQIFEHIGFTVVEGPEIETDYYNFQALNIPPGHPARDDFATFYLPCDNYLLRSQTSTVQIRIMEKVKPPLRVIAPDKVFRPDNLDASHSFMFHQIEGLVVDEETNFSHLKGTLSYFVRKFFGPETKMRFRPHFFPFTEPSAEVDISCIICGGRGCSVCGRKGWLEILGSGLVHPNVLKEVGLDPGIYQGYAFGMGIERIAMLKYGIDDIRTFFNNDIRFLEQFK